MNYMRQLSVAQRQIRKTNVGPKILRLELDRSVKSILSSHRLAPFKKAFTDKRQ